jgi:hypothetical protein
MALFALGDVYLHAAKDYAMAERVHAKSLDVLRRVGDKFGIAHVLLSLGFNHLRQGNYRRAVEFEKEALMYLRELGDKAGIGVERTPTNRHQACTPNDGLLRILFLLIDTI